jgi:hypothetical protein
MRLREIGWTRWDPIGLGPPEAGFADEYDAYLLKAAGDLWNGGSVQEVADYFVTVETDYIGMDASPGMRERALEVASAIREYIDTLRP